ncbi:MAG: DUF4340 domain-containing protein [Candidatus Coatesbacteria bacterium]|nr:DUF4340 domain-containing protein [Candidatus Coatesbacteria bacterium]
MNNRTYIILSIIFVVLVAVYVLIQKTEQKKVINKQDTIEIIPSDFPVDKINKIEMVKGDKKFVLEKRNKIWYVPTSFDYKAEQNKFEYIFKELKGLKAVLKEKDSQILDDYGLGDKNSINVVISTEDGKHVKFLLGKKNPNNNESFIRLLDAKDVLIATKDIHSLFLVYGDNDMPDSKSWVDHKAFQCDRANIKRAEVHLGKDIIILERTEYKEKEEEVDDPDAKGAKKTKKIKEAKWTITSPKIANIDQQKVESFMNAVSSIYANDTCEPGKEKEFGLDPIEKYIIIELDDNKSYKFIYGKMKDNNNSYFKIDGEKAIYAINEYTRNMSIRDAEGYKKEEKKENDASTKKALNPKP